jgi:hypothetical protein
VNRCAVSALPAVVVRTVKLLRNQIIYMKKHALKKHFYIFITPSVFVTVTDVCTVVNDIFFVMFYES